MRRGSVSGLITLRRARVLSLSWQLLTQAHILHNPRGLGRHDLLRDDGLDALRVLVVVEFLARRPPECVAPGTLYGWVGSKFANRRNRDHAVQNCKQNQSVHGTPVIRTTFKRSRI